MKIIQMLVTAMAVSSLGLVNAHAADFLCQGRIGNFAVSIKSAGVQVTDAEGQSCQLPQDLTFDASERGYFQVNGYYDQHPEPEVRKLDLPELVSPEGYLSYAKVSEAQESEGCGALFGVSDFRNLYLKEEMHGEAPQNYRDTVIAVFKASQGWAKLYINTCEAVSTPLSSAF